MKPEVRTLLQSISLEWTFVGYSAFRPRAKRTWLRALTTLGFIEVRTVTISNWIADPRIKDEHMSPYVEARLTPQGFDVKTAQS